MSLFTSKDSDEEQDTQRILDGLDAVRAQDNDQDPARPYLVGFDGAGGPLVVMDAITGHVVQVPDPDLDLDVPDATREKIAGALDVALERVELSLAYLDTLGLAEAADSVRTVLVDLDTARQTHPVLTAPNTPEVRHV